MASSEDPYFAFKNLISTETEKIADATKRIKEACEDAVKKHPWSLEFVPEEFKTYELCMIAVKQDGYTIELIPEEFKTDELCLACLSADYYAYTFDEKPLLRYIPEELMDYDLYQRAMKIGAIDIYNVPYEMR